MYFFSLWCVWKRGESPLVKFNDIASQLRHELRQVSERRSFKMNFDCSLTASRRVQRNLKKIWSACCERTIKLCIAGTLDFVSTKFKLRKRPRLTPKEKCRSTSSGKTKSLRLKCRIWGRSGRTMSLLDSSPTSVRPWQRCPSIVSNCCVPEVDFLNFFQAIKPRRNQNEEWLALIG